MELSTATSLIRKGILNNTRAQRWADLGAGSGLFTQALATCLPAGSVIIAVDRDQQPGSARVVNGVQIGQQTSDFVKDTIPGNLDGILMANALHFVKDKGLFFDKLKHSLRSDGTLIIVEYDTDEPNHWVPFPISFQKLSADFSDRFRVVEQIGHAASVYQRSGMYAASLCF